MANLYLIDRPFAESALGLLKQDADAEVVLIQDGVYLGNGASLGKAKRVYAVRRDVERRGLGQFIGKNVRLIDYPELVDVLFANKVVNFA